MSAPVRIECAWCNEVYTGGKCWSGCGPARLAATPNWSDPRLSQAYELIDAVLADQNQPTESPISETLRRAREAVEVADCELENVQ